VARRTAHGHPERRPEAGQLTVPLRDRSLGKCLSMSALVAAAACAHCGGASDLRSRRLGSHPAVRLGRCDRCTARS